MQATQSEAHSEWHANSGLRSGCPWDCLMYDNDYPEEPPMMTEAQQAVIVEIARESIDVGIVLVSTLDEVFREIRTLTGSGTNTETAVNIALVTERLEALSYRVATEYGA